MLSQFVVKIKIWNETKIILFPVQLGAWKRSFEWTGVSLNPVSEFFERPSKISMANLCDANQESECHDYSYLYISW